MEMKKKSRKKQKCLQKQKHYKIDVIVQAVSRINCEMRKKMYILRCNRHIGMCDSNMPVAYLFSPAEQIQLIKNMEGSFACEFVCCLSI